MDRQPLGSGRKLFRRPGHERVDRLGEAVTLVGEEGRRIGEQPVGLFWRLDAEDLVEPLALARVDRRRIDCLCEQHGRIVLGRHAGTRKRIQCRQVVDIPVFQNGPGDVGRLFADRDPGARSETFLDNARRGDRSLRRGKTGVRGIRQHADARDDQRDRSKQGSGLPHGRLRELSDWAGGSRGDS